MKHVLRRLRLGRTAVAACLLMLVSVSPAHAHGHLKASSPAAGAHLATVPHEIRLDFSEVPEITFVKVLLVNSSGDTIPLDPLSFAADSKRSITAAIRGGLPAGDYTVVWQMAGTDGHVVRDRFIFVIAAGATGVGVAGAPAHRMSSADTAMDSNAHHDPVAMPAGNGFGSESFAYVLIRFAMFVGILLIIGAVSFRQVVLRFLRADEADGRVDATMLAESSRRAARIARGAAYTLVVVALLRLFAQSVAMHGIRDALDTRFVGAMIVETLWGRAWLVQVGAIVLALIGSNVVTGAHPGSRLVARGWMLATIGALVLAVTPAFAGHAATAPVVFPVGIVADGLHVLSAGGWLGSLAMVVFAGIPSALELPADERGPMSARLINAFSPAALLFAAVLITTGVFAAWMHVGSLPALWNSRYGRILLLKLGVLSVVAGTGAYNWLRVRPALGEVEGAVRIRRSATIEVVIALIVLVITAILVATPTAMDMKM